MGPYQYYALTGSDASVDQTSSALLAQFFVKVSVHATTTGTSTGDLKIQASNDNVGLVDANGAPTATNWVDIATQTVAIAGAGNYLIPQIDVAYNFLRFVYTHTNGASGTITVKVHGITFP